MSKSGIIVTSALIALCAYGLQWLTYSGLWFLDMPFARSRQVCAADVMVSHICKCPIVEHQPIGFPFRANYNDECQIEHRPVAWILAADYGLQLLTLAAVWVIMREVFYQAPSPPARTHRPAPGRRAG